MRTRNLFSIVLIALPLLLWSGCAQQDLYEPPGAPFSIVGKLHLPSENEGLSVLGRTAFVAGGQAGLHAIDFTDETNPVLLQTVDTAKYSESITVVRTFVNEAVQDLALMVEGTEGIRSYDVTDPTNMINLQATSTAVFGNMIIIDQEDDPTLPFTCYQAETWKGVRVFQSIPEVPGTFAYDGVFVSTNGYAMSVAVKDGYVYVADDEMGIAVVDMRVLDLDVVELVSWADTPGEALDISLEGDYAYVADGDEGLAIFRIDGPAQPVRMATLELEGKCRSVVVRDDLAILAAQGGGVHFVDVGDPANPIFLGRILTDYAMDVEIQPEGYVLVADRDEGLIVMRRNTAFVDVTPPSPVTSLTAESYSLGAVSLSWHDVGDDRMVGTAASIQVRHADTPILDAADWSAATEVTGAPMPMSPGTAQEFVVTGLSTGMKHFAVRYVDDTGLIGALSNSASAESGGGILLRDAGLDIQGGTTQDTYTYEVTFVYVEEPTVHDVIIDGTAYEMGLVAAKSDERTYRYQTQLSIADHTYAFHFEVADPEVPVASTATVDGPVVGTIAFAMGSTGFDDDEWPHTVVFTDSLVAQVTEVTQEDWMSVGLALPGGLDGLERPAESMTWIQAANYCNLMSDADGYTRAYTLTGQTVDWNRAADGWRLPTEAEWEWLCRAGTTTDFAGGDLTGMVCSEDPVLDAMGWYCGSTFAGTPEPADVRGKEANDRGLFDMHGNVWEWCWDWYGPYEELDPDGDGVVQDPLGPATGSQRVVRGGSWFGPSEDCRSANRGARYPDTSEDLIGLRLVRTIFISK